MTKIFSKIFEFGEKHIKALTLIQFVCNVVFIIITLSVAYDCHEFIDYDNPVALGSFFLFGLCSGFAISMFFELPSLIVDLIFEFKSSKKKNKRISEEIKND